MQLFRERARPCSYDAAQAYSSRLSHIIIITQSIQTSFGAEIAPLNYGTGYSTPISIFMFTIDSV